MTCGAGPMGPSQSAPASPGTSASCEPPREKVRNLKSIATTAETQVAITTKGYPAAELWFDPKGDAGWLNAVFTLYAIVKDVRVAMQTFIVTDTTNPQRVLKVQAVGAEIWEATVTCATLPSATTKFPFILVTYGDSGFATSVAPGGVPGNNEVVFNRNGILDVSPDFTFDRVNRTLRMGQGAVVSNGTIGNAAFFGSNANPSQALGDDSFCIGGSSTTNFSHSGCMGFTNTANGAGNWCAGEVISCTGTNATGKGYNQTASTVYATNDGVSLTNPANYGRCDGFTASTHTGQSGEHASAAGQPNTQRVENELYKVLNNTAGALANADGAAFNVPTLSVQGYIAVFVALTAGGAIAAYEVRLLLVSAVAGPTITVLSNTLLSDAAAGFAAQGWNSMSTPNITAPGGTELRFNASTGTTGANVRFASYLFALQTGNIATP